MLRNAFFALTMASSLLLAAADAFAADPTIHQVYQAAEAGNYQAAQSMMNQVLRDHPNSAKAHFVEAELLAKEGRLANAQSELTTAERLEPGLPFAKPAAVQELRARLALSHGGGRAGVSNSALQTGSSFPWGALMFVAGLVAFIIIVARMMSRRSAYAVQGVGVPSFGGTYGPAQPYGTGGMGPASPAGGMGSGILGGLATGAAVGAGMVAGEALMHRVLDGHGSDGTLAQPEDASWDASQSRYDMGGTDFGVPDASSWDDGSGGGGDDWN